FTLLETIREYATEQLAASGEEAALQQRHAHYFLKLAEEVEPHLSSPEGDIWLERLEREDANLRAALAWSKANQDAVETGLRLAGDKRLTGWAEAVLGVVRLGQGNTVAARPLLEESRTLFKDLGDVWNEAFTLYALGSVVYGSGDPAAARAFYEESLRLFQEQGDEHCSWYAALVLSSLQVVVSTQGDQEMARLLDQQLQPLMQRARTRGALVLFL